MTREQQLEQALRGILEIGKRDMSNPKYDGYFKTAHEALAAPVAASHDSDDNRAAYWRLIGHGSVTGDYSQTVDYVALELANAI